MTRHTIDVLTKKMVCSLGRYPAQMQTTADVAEVLCYQSIDHIHMENITTARRACDRCHGMHQPNRGVHPLPVEPSCPPGWRTGPVAMRPAAAAVRRAPAALMYTGAPARPKHWRRGPRGASADGCGAGSVGHYAAASASSLHGQRPTGVAEARKDDPQAEG